MADTRYVIANRLRAAPPPPLSPAPPPFVQPAEPNPAPSEAPNGPTPSSKPDYGPLYAVLGVLTFLACWYQPALGFVLGCALAVLVVYIERPAVPPSRSTLPRTQWDPFRDFWNHRRAPDAAWRHRFEFNEDLQVRSAGAEGEEYVLRLLHALPDDYVLFNQLDIPNPDSSQGVNEADLVVLGPNALFVIEIKHNHGLIQGSEKSPEWQAIKTGRGGTDYIKTLRNPVAQVKYTAHLLGKYLRARKAKPWVQAVVVFSHPNARLELQGDFTVPVLGADQLLDYLRGYAPPKPVGVNRRRTLEALIELRPHATPPALAAVPPTMAHSSSSLPAP